MDKWKQEYKILSRKNSFLSRYKEFEDSIPILKTEIS